MGVLLHGACSRVVVVNFDLQLLHLGQGGHDGRVQSNIVVVGKGRESDAFGHWVALLFRHRDGPITLAYPLRQVHQCCAACRWQRPSNRALTFGMFDQTARVHGYNMCASMWLVGA